MITGKAKLAAVIGWPVSHSLSPRLHNHWIETYKLDGAYIPLAIMPEDLKDVFRLLPKLGFSGWNVTVPHKEAALKLVDEADQLAVAVGAVNTIIVRKDGTLLGTNTDVYGFTANLKAALSNLAPYKRCAMILGAGGAARAVAKALKDEGFARILITNRTHARAEELVAHIGKPCEVVDWNEKERELTVVTLLINTTTLGMEGQPPPGLSLKTLHKQAAVADIVYKPLVTELLAEAKSLGIKTVGGFGMLIHQAVPGFEAWFGVKPEVGGDLERMILS